MKAQSVAPMPGRYWRRKSRIHDVPYAFYVVAGTIALLLILHEGRKRLAFVSPLLTAVVTFDDAVVAVGLGVRAGHNGRPVLGAVVVTDAFAAVGLILVKRIHRHALLVDEHAVLGLQRLSVNSGGKKGSHGKEYCLGGERTHGWTPCA